MYLQSQPECRCRSIVLCRSETVARLRVVNADVGLDYQEEWDLEGSAVSLRDWWPWRLSVCVYLCRYAVHAIIEHGLQKAAQRATVRYAATVVSLTNHNTTFGKDFLHKALGDVSDPPHSSTYSLDFQATGSSKGSRRQ